jgi:hypothetical protein
MATFQDPLSWSNGDIAHLCMSTTYHAGPLHANRLTKISKKLVVKFGVCVRYQEAANQPHVRLHVDSAVLYAPKVSRHFEDASSGFNGGFLVMKYVRGVGLHALDVGSDGIAKHTMNPVRKLSTIPIATHQGPGPVGNGASNGYLWSGNGTGCTLEIEPTQSCIRLLVRMLPNPKEFPKRVRICISLHVQLNWVVH